MFSIFSTENDFNNEETTLAFYKKTMDNRALRLSVMGIAYLRRSRDDVRCPMPLILLLPVRRTRPCLSFCLFQVEFLVCVSFRLWPTLMPFFRLTCQSLTVSLLSPSLSTLSCPSLSTCPTLQPTRPMTTSTPSAGTWPSWRPRGTSLCTL